MKFSLQNSIRTHLLDAASYSNQRTDLSVKQHIFLDANENPFGEFNRYPDSHQRFLKEKLAVINKTKTENLFLGNGSDELIDLVIRVFCEPAKDSILIMNPSFVMYEIYGKMNNVEVEILELNSDFQIDREYFLEILKDSKAKVLFLCSPNNPTGNSIEDIEFFISNFKGIVVVDEAYIEFSQRESCVTLLQKYPQLIILKTLSKAFGMAGLRIGIGIASPEIASVFNQLKPPFNISSESQRLASEKLEKINEFENQINIILQEKKILEEKLAQLKIVERIFPSDANFILVQFKNIENIYKKLLEQNIYTSLRHPKIPNSLRITVGSAEENLKLLKVLSEIKEV